ncbi:hypothetical protein HY375_00625 [Candidatus Berkelbacteria bacterium]|nr:hypothetical protein [Candidatus Berkelbacteria bacterium]
MLSDVARARLDAVFEANLDEIAARQALWQEMGALKDRAMRGYGNLQALLLESRVISYLNLISGRDGEERALSLPPRIGDDRWSRQEASVTLGVDCEGRPHMTFGSNWAYGSWSDAASPARFDRLFDRYDLSCHPGSRLKLVRLLATYVNPTVLEVQFLEAVRLIEEEHQHRSSEREKETAGDEIRDLLEPADPQESPMEYKQRMEREDGGEDEIEQRRRFL